MSDTFSFGSGDDHVGGGRVKPWKAESGQTYRLSFAWWPIVNGKPDLPGGKPCFTGKQTHFIQGVGYVINQGAEYTKLANDTPRTRIATVIVVWPTDKRGVLAKDRLDDAEVRPWVISGEKYKTLELVHREFSFGDHDITAKCEENGATYQKLTFSPCKENLYRQLLGSEKYKALGERIQAEVSVIVSTIDDHVGRKMTIQQIREKLAGGGGNTTTNFGGGGGGSLSSGGGDTSAGDIESIVDGLLDT